MDNTNSFDIFWDEGKGGWFNLMFVSLQNNISMQKASAPWGRPDEVIDLHGASVEMNNKEKTSRKNSILVSLS